MTVEHLILARTSSIDGERNVLSVFEFIEDMTIPADIAKAPPGGAIEAQVIIVCRRDSERGPFARKLRLEYHQPDGDVRNIDLSADFAAGIRRHRNRVVLSLMVSKPGEHRFQLKESPGKKTLAQISIVIDWVAPTS